MKTRSGLIYLIPGRNKSLLLLLNTACLAEKQQIAVLFFCLTRLGLKRGISMATITFRWCSPPIRLGRKVALNTHNPDSQPTNACTSS